MPAIHSTTRPIRPITNGRTPKTTVQNRDRGINRGRTPQTNLANRIDQLTEQILAAQANARQALENAPIQLGFQGNPNAPQAPGAPRRPQRPPAETGGAASSIVMEPRQLIL